MGEGGTAVQVRRWLVGARLATRPALRILAIALVALSVIGAEVGVAFLLLP
jgi:hypothetical protein